MGRGLGRVRPRACSGPAKRPRHFYPPPPRNPKANEGYCSVEGHRSAAGRVVVTAVRWIFQPPNYVTVDLVGELGVADCRCPATSGRLLPSPPTAIASR